MAKIYNSDLTQNIIRSTKASTSRDSIPNEIAEKVLPVIDVNPFPNRIADIVKVASCVNATSGTIYTTPTTADFYLTNASLSVQKDATSTSTSIRLTFTQNGATTSVLAIAGLTLTALHADQTISLPFPIKVDRGTSIILSSDTAVANITIRGTICGFLIND